MKNSILIELKGTDDRNRWIECLRELRKELKPLGGSAFAKATGLTLRAERLKNVESTVGGKTLDSWDIIFKELQKTLSEVEQIT